MWRDVREDRLRPGPGEKLLARCRQFVKLYIEVMMIMIIMMMIMMMMMIMIYTKEAVLERIPVLVKPMQLGCTKAGRIF